MAETELYAVVGVAGHNIVGGGDEVFKQVGSYFSGHGGECVGCACEILAQIVSLPCTVHLFFGEELQYVTL